MQHMSKDTRFWKHEKYQCFDECKDKRGKKIEQWKYVWMLIPLLQMVLSEEIQGLVGVMLQMVEVITGMMDKILPAIDQLQSYLFSFQDLNLQANIQFKQVCTL